MKIENAIVVIGKTRLEQLIDRFNSKAQARFYIEHAGGDFEEYLDEHNTFVNSLARVTSCIRNRLVIKILERRYLSNFLFSEKDVIIVVGQDGLVANVAKYSNGLPILAVNPDPSRNDGFLLPFDPSSVEDGLHHLLKGEARSRLVTMAEARSNDGHRLLAFNDLFIGPASHTSARYKLTYQSKSEDQSSSGLIVSTGAGSTGWLSSVLNMANGIRSVFHGDHDNINVTLDWDTDRLVFVVREPFQSRHSEANLTAGLIQVDSKLIVESYMPSNGVIFSDGIEADYIPFNAGTSVEIGIASQKARIVQRTGA
jgi:NAD kinase